MNTTKADSFAVDSTADLRSVRLNRLGFLSSHGAALGRRCDADEYRAQYQEYQEQRRHHHESDLLGQMRQEPQACDLADGPVQHRHRKREENGNRHRQDDEIGAAIRLGADDEIADQPGDDREDGQRCQAPAAARLAKPDRVGRQARCSAWRYLGDKKDVSRIERRQHEPRDEGAFVHVADRPAELVGHDDQHERRRDDLRKRA
jgi:hypothetical protein